MMRRPWAERSDELFDEEGHYADFAAWEEWVEDRDTQHVFDAIATIDRVFIYAMFCDAIDQTTFQQEPTP